MTSHTWWWGTYPAEGLGAPVGTGEGLFRMDADGSTADIALELPAPSYVIAHPDLPLLYAVSEGGLDVAAVHAIDVSNPDATRVLGTVRTGGHDPCHILMARDTLSLYVSHYSSGELAVIRLGADGLFDSDEPAQSLGHSGNGPTERQDAPHAHWAAYAPGGGTLLVADLGTDELRRYDVLPDGLLRPDGVAATLPPGAGPRLVLVRNNLLYVVCELDLSLKTYSWDAEARIAELIVEQPASVAPHRSGDSVSPAMLVHVAGVLLLSVRGADVISVFDLDGNDLPSLRGSFDTGGQWPRHFAVAGERVVVGNEKSHNAAVFDLADVLALKAPEEAEEIVELAHSSIAVTSPACICPV